MPASRDGQRIAVASQERDPEPLDPAALRRIRDRTAMLPLPPWRAVELSQLEVHGSSEFDPVVDVSRAAWERNEQTRAETAAWRGVVAADGMRVVGEPLPGGRRTSVHDPVLLWVVEMREAVPALLATLRQLWPRRTDQEGIVANRDQTAPARWSKVDVEQAARAAYEQRPGVERWDELPELHRQEWVDRIEAALDTITS